MREAGLVLDESQDAALESNSGCVKGYCVCLDQVTSAELLKRPLTSQLQGQNGTTTNLETSNDAMSHVSGMRWTIPAVAVMTFVNVLAMSA